MSVVSSKHQITIPADVMREAGIRRGDEVTIRAVGPGHVEVVKVEELLAEFAGSLDSTVYPEGYLDDVRDGWR